MKVAAYRRLMSDEELTPADPDDLAAGLAFALQFEQGVEIREHGFDARIIGERLFQALALLQKLLVRLRPELGRRNALFNFG